MKFFTKGFQTTVQLQTTILYKSQLVIYKFSRESDRLEIGVGFVVDFDSCILHGRI